MLASRVASGLVLGIVVLALVLGGVIWVAAGSFIVFAIALYEYRQLFARGDFYASFPLMLGWLALFFADRLLPEVHVLPPGAAVLLILNIVWMEWQYMHGVQTAIYGVAITLTGSFYVGWAGAHFVGLRALDDGLFWTLTAILANVFADTGAYAVGSLIGRHKLIPRISPGKTWEGYLGAIVLTIGLTSLFTLLWRRLGASDAVSPLHGAAIGALVSIIGPVGDFGVSVVKRTVDAKNTSNLIPGHGGLLDRIDVLLITGLLSYYYITFVVL